MVELRHVDGPDELRACVELQRETWGEAFVDVVPVSLLQVSQKTGGLLGGAFEEEELLGLVYSLLALAEDELTHWSHMLAVRPAGRGRGLGRRLKLFQRDVLLERGIRSVFWSYDPMVARNAHLNLNRLGVTVLRYVPNMYGEETGSPLHAGGETDRFIVRWDLESRRVRWAIGAESTAPIDRAPDEASTVARPEPEGGGAELPEGDEVFVEIPVDLRTEAADREGLRRWRAAVRDAFTTYLRRGYAVQSLHRDADAGRAFYFLRRS